MISIVLEKPEKIKKITKRVEIKLKVKIDYAGNTFRIRGEEYNEFLCQEVLRAVDFGFDVEDALLLMKEDYSFQIINIKEHTTKKNLEPIRARVIGANGRAKGTIGELTGSVIVVNVNQVGIIVSSEHLSQVVQSIVSLIRGAKHANIFAYLEKQNSLLKKFDEEDLGLKPDKNQTSKL